MHALDQISSVNVLALIIGAIIFVVIMIMLFRKKR